MTFLNDILSVLAFRPRALRSLAARRALLRAVLCLVIGFLAYILVRNTVYAPIATHTFVQRTPSFLETFLDSNLIQTMLFLSMIYVPALIVISNSFAGDGLGFSISRTEYTLHLSALFPLWGILLLITAPVQWLLPQFLVLGPFGISIGLLCLLASMAVYTVWALKELNYLPLTAAGGVFALSWLTLPVFFIISAFLLALPFLIVLPLLYVAFMRFRELMSAKRSIHDFQRHLRSLTLNPRDADAHYQLGLLHLQRGNLHAAQGNLEHAIEIDPDDPDYHYFMGKVFEAREEWTRALAAYEEAYRLSPEYRLGDIFREVGKGYLHTDQLDKAAEFLRFFLQRRSTDLEGRYWLAVVLEMSGKLDEMRNQLHTLLEQARTSPRFFRRENREWIYRARILLRRPATEGRIQSPTTKP